MLKLNDPQQYWGIAHWGTEVTGALFTDELFVFKKDAQAYIERLNAARAESNETPLDEGYARPVLLNVTATICSDEATELYDQQQVHWLARKSQSSLRAKGGPNV
jgi:hypothetical protein